MKDLNKLMSSYGKAASIGGAIGGATSIGFFGGIALEAGTIATVICPPAGIIVGSTVAIGAGLGALSKFIFS